MKMSKVFWILALSAVVGSWNAPKGFGRQTESHDEHAEEGDAHEHAEVGPHGGHLVELGEEEFHAEIVHDEEKGTITIHLLDGTAKKLIAIPAPQLLINLKHGQKVEQFKLAAAPIETDPKGMTSRYVSEDAELAEDLDAEGCEAKLVVVISGKQYRGDVTHHHDEEDSAEHAAEHADEHAPAR